ncbi:MarR family winged helix-turn-helix transcriptional regulator [Kineococcus sp. TBRC 1896]|uniref:MarR family winged helix-turn-helix transcriptional regulator n=1 Tax=Kineococcus mangrovi TaxID=1660183 RepID=A0ABV4I3L4_9ACTN
MSREDLHVTGLGTQLRRLLDRLEHDVADLGADLGLEGWRPRYSPVVRAVLAHGPLTIREVARATGVTHSAASQTVAQMRRDGWLRTARGVDGRERVVDLTGRARELVPLLEREWRTTEVAVADLDAELPMPLGELLTSAERALDRRSLRERMP